MPTKKHTVNVYEENLWPDRPWRSLCATCGNDGRFASRQEAVNYANVHITNVTGGIVFEVPAKGPVKANPAFNTNLVKITNDSLPGGVVGTPYSATLVATGTKAPSAWRLSEGNLPVGLNLVAASGQIAGTPSSVGSPIFTVTVTDADQKIVAKTLSISIGPTSASPRPASAVPPPYARR